MEKPKYVCDHYGRCGPGKRPKFAAFDFETDGLGGDVLAVSWQIEGKEVGYAAGRDPVQAVFDVMCDNLDCVWYAHNAQYEWRYFLNRLIEYRSTTQIFSRSDSDVYMLKIGIPDYEDEWGKIPVLEMRDSLAILPDSLRNLADKFCPELPKLTLDFENVKFDPKDADHIEYSKRDSESLLLILQRFDSMLFESFDIHVKGTASSTGMAAWERSLDHDEKYYNTGRFEEEFIRSAYFGGLVFLTDTNIHEVATSYDINSSYPYQMREHAVPAGKPWRTRLFDRNRLGIYQLVLKAPDGLVVPIIPVRKGNSILWPAGTFEATITSEEILFALDHGYRIIEIKTGLVFPDRVKPFSDFVTKCETLRSLHKGSPLEMIVKLMQNSVYGKFGARRKRRRFHSEFPSDVPKEEVTSWGDDFFVTEEDNQDMRCMPHWAVFITARARLHLLSAVYEVGPENCLYGDTDSITVKSGVEITTGDKYGDWKKDKIWIDFRARAPKQYAGHMIDKNGAIITKGAAKGIPRREWDKQRVLDKVFAGEQAIITYGSLEKFVMAMKTGYIGEHDKTRSLTRLENSASWDCDAAGRVRPRKMG